MTLPIDQHIKEIRDAINSSASVILSAPPGSGKTTRLPLALLETDQQVLILEPRRLAARMAARWVSSAHGTRLGATIGYQVRFDDCSSSQTRVKFITEGILIRTLASNPHLKGVGMVILDEFHERHLHADVALALLKRLQRTVRPDLKIVVMSATLQVDGLESYLETDRVLEFGQSPYNVEISYLSNFQQRPLEQLVAEAVSSTLSRSGDILVFLPGAAEIRKAREACAQLVLRHGLKLCALHGEMPAEEQDEAVRPSPQRKVILSTNVAESSITIDGVSIVIDSGLARKAGYSVWSGLPYLKTERVCKASAIQRAGRAGRTGHGSCLRLYSAQDYQSRPDYDPPEIAVTDISETLLQLTGLGIDPESLDWFEAPSPSQLEAARELLERLGALQNRQITPVGRRMLKLALHPRLSRIVVAGQDYGVGKSAATIAALISERDIRTDDDKLHTDSDLLRLLDLFEEAERNLLPERLKRLGVAPRALSQVRRVCQQLSEGYVGYEPESVKSDELVLKAILTGFPDRVARVRYNTDPPELVFGQGAARLSPLSTVRNAPLVVAVECEQKVGAGRAAQTLVRLASRIEPEWLLDLYPERVTEATELVWNPVQERVDQLDRMLYDAVVIHESRRPAKASAEASQLLYRAAAERGFLQEAGIERLLARIDFLARACPELKLSPPDKALLEDCLRECAEGCTSIAEMRQNSIHALIERRLGVTDLLRRMAPEYTSIAGRRHARIEYEVGKTPFIASRLQDFFGMTTGPRVADGRVALVLHLLAPNQRPVQITADLEGFWKRAYPEVKRELQRRYPKHRWPDDPLKP